MSMLQDNYHSDAPVDFNVGKLRNTCFERPVQLKQWVLLTQITFLLLEVEQQNLNLEMSTTKQVWLCLLPSQSKSKKLSVKSRSDGVKKTLTFLIHPVGSLPQFGYTVLQMDRSQCCYTAVKAQRFPAIFNETQCCSVAAAISSLFSVCFEVQLQCECVFPNTARLWVYPTQVIPQT